MLPYRAQELTGWFDEDENDVNQMLWPSQSHDLKPAEHLQYGRLWNNSALHQQHQNTKWAVHPSCGVTQTWEAMRRGSEALLEACYVLPSHFSPRMTCCMNAVAVLIALNIALPGGKVQNCLIEFCVNISHQWSHWYWNFIWQQNDSAAPSLRGKACIVLLIIIMKTFNQFSLFNHILPIDWLSKIILISATMSPWSDLMTSSMR